MSNDIQLLKNNNNRNWSDIQWVEEFYDFLQGKIPEGIYLKRGNKPKLTPKQAMTVIWFMQEQFPVLPDTIERCYRCNYLYDSNSEGLHWETKGRLYCGNCSYEVPEHYDRGKK